MTRTRLFPLFTALLLAIASCGDSDNGPPPGADGGKQDLPPPVGDGGTQQDHSTIPPGDGGPTGDSSSPTQTNGHMEEACSTGLYQLNVGKEQSTCQNVLILGIDVLQILVGDNLSKPPHPGRTYTVKDQSQVQIYPEDGEATAVFILGAGGVQSVTSGTFKVDPYAQGAQVFSGSYDVTLGNGQTFKGNYLADFCPFDPSSCGD